MTVRPRAGGWVELRRALPVPGATVVGAWLLPDGPSVSPTTRLDAPALDPGALASAAVGGLEATALPARLDAGTTARLAVLWRIDDCRALDGDVRVRLVVRTAGGPARRTGLASPASPAWDPGSLRLSGVCPA